MRTRMFIVPFMLSLFLGIQIFLLPSQVSASCCGCGNCWMMYMYGSQFCYCGGDCPTCLTDDFNSYASTANRSGDTSSISETLLPAIAKATVTEQVMKLTTGSKCFRDKLALSLLGNVLDDLKFEPKTVGQQNVLALQTIEEPAK